MTVSGTQEIATDVERCWQAPALSSGGCPEFILIS